MIFHFSCYLSKQTELKCIQKFIKLFNLLIISLLQMKSPQKKKTIINHKRLHLSAYNTVHKKNNCFRFSQEKIKDSIKQSLNQTISIFFLNVEFHLESPTKVKLSLITLLKIHNKLSIFIFRKKKKEKRKKSNSHSSQFSE